MKDCLRRVKETISAQKGRVKLTGKKEDLGARHRKQPENSPAAMEVVQLTRIRVLSLTEYAAGEVSAGNGATSGVGTNGT